MAIKEIALLGNPILRKRCAPVRDYSGDQTRQCIGDLRETLADFRKGNGFGRGIAAPQIGLTKQILYLDTDFEGALINPRIVERSRKTFTLWDDCFSFPDILIKVQRHYSVSVVYCDEVGAKKKLKAVGALSELLQHEIDHLHGILAIDRAIDSRHIILRSEFKKLSDKRALTL
jgi:peptide deformylase